MPDTQRTQRSERTFLEAPESRASWMSSDDVFRPGDRRPVRKFLHNGDFYSSGVGRIHYSCDLPFEVQWGI
jgi:hypothetical protein